MNRLTRFAPSAVGVALLFAEPASAQLNATTVATGFNQPVFAASAPGRPETLYVVEQGGLIRPLNTATGQVGATPLLNLSSVAGANLNTAGSEQGLLGLAFHPNFQSNGLFYVQYTYRDVGMDAGGAVRVEQYQAVNGVADPASRRTVIQFDHPVNTNHNAGWIGFNPQATGAAANYLYFPTGDGGGANDTSNNAQNTNSLLGKILRVDVGGGLTAANPTYTIPAGNMTGAGVRPELYSNGLRNPYRASFDRATGNLYVGDVGQNSREEINFIANGSAGGQNFGWRVREGTIQNPAYPTAPVPAGAIDPIHDYGRAIGTTVTGGYVYRGTWRDDDGNPLDGHYFFADFGSGRVWSLKYDGQFVATAIDRTAELGFTVGQFNPSSFAEDGFGNLYLIAYNGTVYQIVPVAEPAAVGLVAGGAVAAWLARRRWLPRASPTHTVPE